ncbi:beta-keto acid cleavage family enzyme [Chelatococcus asaccharovorans]|uniref:3-keto-5-aminohexanoate cleavage protein n=1 Tax=Chelatococcus asaccharovorans TaxID=28210 RepID=UPI00224C7A4D|nr:3-keto-5-aminohexanoate cleavage protein [Chelatococcus asaccharovorans]CAH1660143.1 3-keto-5-aminohexanoate cleavage enzyme [Chelatococcus asaccharovorans]CAH1683919.1 3-keto-5-aminohexanoate cleavage enzyme [Chelatococcus asaccharovorans]
MSTRKVIITIAPTGGFATKAHTPYVPTQPEEIAEDVRRCVEAGASVAALHARRPDDEATCDGAIYRRINELVRARCDVIINNSTGGGVNGDMVSGSDRITDVIWSERLKGLDGGADMCTMDAMTFIATAPDGREVVMKTPSSRATALAELMRQKGIKPEWEAFSPTHILQDAARLIAAGYDSAPYFFNLVFGLDTAFQGALPYTPKLLQMMIELLPAGALFNVSTIGPDQLHAMAHALILGGHLRVGIEDNPYLSPGVPGTNVQFVERAVRIVRELGLEPATTAEAREMLGLAPGRGGVHHAAAC